MTGNVQQRHRLAFWLVLAGTTLCRLWVISRWGLSVDEAHYAMYARRLAWGYFDHPPMVGFLIALTTRAGHGAFFVRLGPVLCSALVMLLLRRLALALYGDERVGFWATVLMNLMPYYHALAVAALPDATLNLFWCGALLAAWHGVRGGRWAPWLLAGACFGGAMLSKYHGVLLPLCLGGFLLASRERRRWFARPHPYVAGAVGAALFLPNVLWNARHGWVSYAFQLGHGGGDLEWNWLNVLEMIGGQMGAASPVVPGLLAAAAVRLWRRRPLRDADSFVLWTSLPVFAFFCGVGTVGKILPHWPFVAWWTGALAIVSVFLTQLDAGPASSRVWRKWAMVGAAVAAAMIVFMYAALSKPIVGALHNGARAVSLRLHARCPAVPAMEPFQSRYDLSNDLYGWDEAAGSVRAVWAAMPRPSRTFVFCHRFFASSQLAVHLDPEVVVTTLHRRPSQYRLWFVPESHTGWDAVFADDDHDLQGPDRYAALFESVNREPAPVRVWRDGQVAHSLNLYRCYGFRGRYEE